MRLRRRPPDPAVGRGAWLFPAAFAVHVLEEAPGFTDWARRYASERYTQRDFVRNNAIGLVMTGAATVVVTRVESRPAFLVYYSTVLTQQALFNALFHAGATVAFRTYSPGLLTALALFLPLWYRITRTALRDGVLTRNGMLVASAIGGLIHAAVVARQVFFVELPELSKRAAA